MEFAINAEKLLIGYSIGKEKPLMMVSISKEKPLTEFSIDTTNIISDEGIKHLSQVIDNLENRYNGNLKEEFTMSFYDKQDEYLPYFHKIYVILIYNILLNIATEELLQEAMQLENCARRLDEGTWVDMGGGEYAKLPNVENWKARINILSLAYGKLNRFEGRIEEDWERAKIAEGIGGWEIIECSRDIERLADTAKAMGSYGGIGLARGLEAVKNLLKWYHAEAEFVAPLVNGKTLAIPCGNGWGQQGEQIPERLNTPEAKKWLDKAMEAGFLDEWYQPTGKLGTRAMQAYFAELFGEKAGIHRGRYAAFEALWGIKHMAKERYEAREIKGRVKGGEVVEAFFGVNHAKH